MQVEHGRIAALAFRGDFFSAEEPELLAQKLIGLPPEKGPLGSALADLDVSRYMMGLETEQLLELLSE